MTTAVVESVSHFVSNNGTNRPIVDCVIGIREKEWTLEDSGRKHDLIAVRAVIRIHHLWYHPPFRGINRLADPGKMPFHLEGLPRKDVEDIGLAADLQLAVVPPLVGITNFYAQSVELFDCMLFRLIPH